MAPGEAIRAIRKEITTAAKIRILRRRVVHVSRSPGRWASGINRSETYWCGTKPKRKRRKLRTRSQCRVKSASLLMGVSLCLQRSRKRLISSLAA